MPGVQPGQFQGPVAGRGAEGKSNQDREPVEELAGAGGDGVDRQGPLAGVPDPEDNGEDPGEHATAQREGNALAVGEDVGVQSAGHAHHHDGEPVHERDVAFGGELPAQDTGQNHGEDQ